MVNLLRRVDYKFSQQPGLAIRMQCVPKHSHVGACICTRQVRTYVHAYTYIFAEIAQKRSTLTRVSVYSTEVCVRLCVCILWSVCCARPPAGKEFFFAASARARVFGKTVLTIQQLLRCHFCSMLCSCQRTRQHMSSSRWYTCFFFVSVHLAVPVFWKIDPHDCAHQQINHHAALNAPRAHVRRRLKTD